MHPILRYAGRLSLCVTLALGTFACSQLVQQHAATPQAVTINSSAIATSGLKPLSLSDVMQFREIKDRSLSADQAWLIFTAEPDFGDSTGHVQHILSDKHFSLANADNGSLNHNGSFALFRQRAPLLVREQAKDDKAARDALPHDAVLLNTQTGEQRTFSNVERFAFSGDGNTAVLLKRKAASKDSSQLLQVVNLQTGQLTELGQVTQFAVAGKGDLVVFVAELPAAENSKQPQQQVKLYQADTGQISVLTSAATRVYQQPVFSPDGQQLVFLAGAKAEKGRETAQQLWHWAATNTEHNTDTVAASELVLTHSGWLLSVQQAPKWSEDGSRVLLGFRPVQPDAAAKPAVPQNDSELYDITRLSAERRLQVWHGQDERISPQQKAEYQQALKRTAPAVYWLNGTGLVVLSNEVDERLYQSEHSQAALISSGKPYLTELTWEGRLHDVWHVNLTTGARQQVFARNSGFERAHLSPSGRYAVYQQQGKYWLFDSTTAKRRELGSKAGVSWVDETHDRPEPAASYGVAGWLDDESAVLVYDRFDIWQLSLDGSARNITKNGRSSKQRYRLEQTDAKALAIAANAPLLVNAFNEEYKNSGFYQLSLTEGTLSALLTGDNTFTFISALPEQNGYLYTRQSFRQFPDLWFAKTDFSEQRQLTDVNPQQAGFIWGDGHLIDWYTQQGERLQGVVLTPDGYDASKRYPVLVYYYESFSDRLHQYNPMRVNHRPNFPFYLGQGYVVFLPDIHFREGAPGPSATESLLPAIDRLIELGIADPNAIGLHGHSWSGYQTAFVVTETDRFAAAIAGAPVSNMTSAYNGIRWQTGLARQFQYETGQSRIGQSMFENLKPYIDNSPVFFADRIKTPLVIQFGDEDGAVPWEQGIEMYLALRRLNKAVVMLQYEGEDHHLALYANKVDYSIKMLEFFNHFLKGEPAPAWWQQGIPYQPTANTR